MKRFDPSLFGRLWIPKGRAMSLPLKLGSKDPQRKKPTVTGLQTRLRRHGYDVSVDGNFGKQTQTAVMSFQSKHGLAVDGVVGERTWAALLDADQPTPPAPTPEPEPTPVPTPTPSTGKSFAERRFGAYVEDTSGGTLWTLESLSNMETKLGKKLDIVSGFCQGGDLSDLVPNMTKVASAGKDVLLSYDVQWTAADILAGKWDAQFKGDALAAKKVPGLVVLRLWAEMNGNWATWSVTSSNRKVNSTSDWIAAWKHIVNVFRLNNASNVKFCWCPNVTDEGSTKLEAYYPGSDWVDLLGFDGYNWGNPWQTHAQVFTPIYNRLIKLDTKLPIWIGETASAETAVGQKAAWVTNFLKDTAFPRIEAVAWFSTSKERDWRLDSSAGSLTAFKSGIQ